MIMHFVDVDHSTSRAYLLFVSDGLGQSIHSPLKFIIMILSSNFRIEAHVTIIV